MYINHEKYALVNGVVLDGTRDMAPRTRLAVCVDGDRIAAVCDAADVPEGYARVDLGGKYLLPGLINLHVHLPASGKPRKKPSDPKKLVKLITSNGLMRRIGVKMCEGYARTGAAVRRDHYPYRGRRGGLRHDHSRCGQAGRDPVSPGGGVQYGGVGTRRAHGRVAGL